MPESLESALSIVVPVLVFLVTGLLSISIVLAFSLVGLGFVISPTGGLAALAV